MTETASEPDETAADGFKVRAYGDDLWSTVELGERFAKGMYIFGSASQLFKISVSLLCIDVLSQDVSKTPLELRERVAGGSILVPPDKHPVAALLNRPSKFYGPKKFLRMLTANLVTSSEYFIAVARTRAGAPIEMQGIPKRQTSVAINPEARRYFYDFSATSMHDMAQFGWAAAQRMTDEDVAHLISRTTNGIDALSTSMLSKGIIDLLDEMQSYQSGVFANGGLPVMAFKFPNAMTDVQFDRLAKDLNSASQMARKSGKPFILEGADGVIPELEKVSLSAVDTQFVNTHEAAGVEAARFFRVPPHKVFLLASVKYDNQAEQERLYVDDALCPIFDVIEEGLGAVLLTESDRKKYFLQFDRSKAYASDPETTRKIVETQWKNGMIEYDEMRQIIGRNAVGGDAGQARMMSGNFVLVDRNNDVIMRAGGNAPEAAPDDDKPDTTDANTTPKKALRLVDK